MENQNPVPEDIRPNQTNRKIVGLSLLLISLILIISMDIMGAIINKRRQINIKRPTVTQLADRSAKEVVPTLATNGMVYATGIEQGAAFSTVIYNNGANGEAIQSYGLSSGLIAFTRKKRGFIGNDLFIADPVKGYETKIAPDFNIVNAQWIPGTRKLALIYQWGREYGILLYDYERKETKAIIQGDVHGAFLRVAKDGDAIYYTAVKENQTYLTRVSTFDNSKSYQVIDASLIPLLAMVDESQIYEVAQNGRTELDSTGREEIVLNNRDEKLTAKLGLIKDALQPVYHFDGGLIMESIKEQQIEYHLFNDVTKELIAIGKGPQTANTVLCGTQPTSWYLKFPVPNRTATTSTINTVFDHSSPFYNVDNQVIAFTGEIGKSVYGKSADAYGASSNLYGFKNKTGDLFVLNGQNGKALLYYDGHNGYDIKTTDQGTSVSILAPADATMTVVKDSYNTIVLDFNNGYTMKILHASSRIINPGVSKSVKAGDPIGVFGGVGANGQIHCHLEVYYNGVLVDPYGWHGQYPDPRGSVASTNLWKPKAYAACDVRWHPNGTLISDGQTVFLISGSQKRAIPSESIFRAYGYDFADVIYVSSEELVNYSDGANLNLPPTNRLINVNGTVYEITDLNKKRAFTSAQAFLGQGFRWDDVKTGSVTGIADDPNVPIYKSIFRDGSLVKNGTTIYVVSDAKLFPFASLGALTSLGYRAEDAIPLTATIFNSIPKSNCVITETSIKQGDPCGDFNLTITPSTQTAALNSTATFTVMPAVVGTFNSSIALSVAGLPAGVNASITPANISATANAQLTINTGTANAGVYPIQVIGASNGKVHMATATLTISQPAAQTGTIIFLGDLDGQPISAPVNVYTLSGPEPCSVTSLPTTLTNKPAGTFHFAFNGNGPNNSIFTGWEPSDQQQLTNNGTITFKLHFRSSVQPPATPTNLTGNAISPTQASLQWQLNGGETAIEIYLQTGSDPLTLVKVVSAGTTSTTISNLKSNTNYLVTIRAINAGGASLYADPINIQMPFAPAMAVFPFTARTLPTTPVNSSVTDSSLVILNRGDGDLIIYSIQQISGSTDFSLGSPTNFSVTIPGQSSLSLTFKFVPTSHGPKQAVFRVQTSDAQHPTQDLVLESFGQ